MGFLQWFVMAVLALAVFVVQVVALVDAARRPDSGYRAEGRVPKVGWLAILGVAAALGFLGLPQGWLQGGFMFGSFLNIIAVAPALIYWVSVRPRLQPYGTGGKPRGPRSGW